MRSERDRRRYLRPCSGGPALLRGPGLSAAARLGERALAEERSRADRAVERGPGGAGCQLLLEPVEAAEASAEVVDHVHERRLARARHHRAAMLERAVVGQDDVPERLRERRREAADLLDLAADAVVAERDLAVQASRIGQLDRAAALLVGLELADVVQQCASHRDVP